MTITKQCQLVADDYLFLDDKLKVFHTDITSLQYKKQIEALSNLFLTFLEPPASEIFYPSIPKTTLERVELRIRDALKQPLDRIPLAVDASITEFQNEMWEKVVDCECGRRAVAVDETRVREVSNGY